MPISLPLTDATRRLGAPATWDDARDGICRTLEIVDRDGWMISAWAFSPTELQRLQDGEPLFLHIQGREHPVVGFTVGGGE